MTVGEKIRNARKKAGMTQKQLGEKAGIAEPTIRKYESNKLNPKYATIQNIANALSINSFDLLPDEAQTALSDKEDNPSIIFAKVLLPYLERTQEKGVVPVQIGEESPEGATVQFRVYVTQEELKQIEEAYKKLMEAYSQHGKRATPVIKELTMASADQLQPSGKTVDSARRSNGPAALKEDVGEEPAGDESSK